MDSRESARSPHRLRTLAHPWQFRYCYDAGLKVVTRHSVAFLRVHPDGDGVRVGVVASRKVGGAVQRNRAKRLLREAARHLVGRLIERNIWVVLVAKSSIVGQNARDVQDDIERSLIEAGTLARSPHLDLHRK